jgi:hypothetical protein
VPTATNSSLLVARLSPLASCGFGRTSSPPCADLEIASPVAIRWQLTVCCQMGESYLIDPPRRRRGREAEGGGLLKREHPSFQWFPVISNPLQYDAFEGLDAAQSLDKFGRQFGRQRSGRQRRSARLGNFDVLDNGWAGGSPSESGAATRRLGRAAPR